MDDLEPKTHVYFMPGMAANPSIFEYINLPKKYVIHWLKWKIPYHNESMHSYITRMLEDVVHADPKAINFSFYRKIETRVTGKNEVSPYNRFI